jgi:hypothetical protein
MGKLVSLHVTLVTECFFTHITRITTPATMYKLVILHVTLVIECLITHIT